jgi:murein L,D-transpeptidase YcbB/YkuD
MKNSTIYNQLSKTLMVSGALLMMNTSSLIANVSEHLPNIIQSEFPEVVGFYDNRDYEPIFVSTDKASRDRKKALLQTISSATRHGLPTSKYQADLIKRKIKGAKSDVDKARLEVEMVKAYSIYVRDIQTGLLDPREVNKSIDRNRKVFDVVGNLKAYVLSDDPIVFLAGMAPQSVQYRKLILEKLRMEKEYKQGDDTTKMQAITVAMERERWLSDKLGKRHVIVNLPEFQARIINNGKTEFSSKVVVGKNSQQTPEFSDAIEHMIINPSWHVPRSIVVNEYFPKFKGDRWYSSNLIMSDKSGNPVNRARVDFSRYNSSNFPFTLRQPPGRNNALGVVKFMFPNLHNVYLHDTPAKKLFARDMRAHSHGCIRLHKPQEFGYALLSVQQDDPEGYFNGKLKTRRETRINLDIDVPVHILYRTAYISPGEASFMYFDDIYGRDAEIWNELFKAGVRIEPFKTPKNIISW